MRISVVFVDEHTFLLFFNSNTHFLIFGITCIIGAHYWLDSGASVCEDSSMWGHVQKGSKLVVLRVPNIAPPWTPVGGVCSDSHRG